MKIYDNRNNKNLSACSYCRHNGHNKRYCPALRKHWETNKHRHYDTTPYDAWEVSSTDFNFYSSLSDTQASRRFDSHYFYIKKIMETSTPTTTPKKRKAPQCGFCKSKTHTRRNCSHMGEFVKALEETNKGYRKAFYETVFVEQGIGLGAFVEFKRYAWNNRDNTPNPTSLILDIDFEAISIGNLFSRWSQWTKELNIELRYEDNKFNLKTQFLLDSSFPLLDRKGLQHLSTHYEGITKVIVPAPSLPDKEWFLGQSPAFEWVVKKKKLEDLFFTYQNAIHTFHPDGEEVIKKFKEII